jgi:hypothetical protein
VRYILCGHRNSSILSCSIRVLFVLLFVIFIAIVLSCLDCSVLVLFFVFEIVGLQPGEYVIQKPDSVKTRIILNFKRPLNLEEDPNPYVDDEDDEDEDEDDEYGDVDENLPCNVSAFESEDLEEDDDFYDDVEDAKTEEDEDKDDEKVRNILRNKSTCIYTLPADVVNVRTTSECDLKNLSISSCLIEVNSSEISLSQREPMTAPMSSSWRSTKSVLWDVGPPKIAYDTALKRILFAVNEAIALTGKKRVGKIVLFEMSQTVTLDELDGALTRYLTLTEQEANAVHPHNVM